jgi:transposase
MSEDAKIVSLDDYRPPRVERQKCRECGHEQISVYLASLNCQWWECSNCKAQATQEVVSGKND